MFKEFKRMTVIVRESNSDRQSTVSNVLRSYAFMGVMEDMYEGTGELLLTFVIPCRDIAAFKHDLFMLNTCGYNVKRYGD